MNIQRILTVLAFAAAIFFPSCIRDKVDGRPSDGEWRPGVRTHLTFNAVLGKHTATRADGYDKYDDDQANINFPVGNADDSHIETFRVLIYDHATGELVSLGTRPQNYLFTAPSETETVDEEVRSYYRIDIDTGIYDFVFIANENTLESTLGGNHSTGAAIEDIFSLQALLLSRDADGTLTESNGDIHGELNIPMVRVIENVQVVGSDTVKLLDEAGTPEVSSIWDVVMVRAAIRLSFHIKMDKAQYEAWLKYHTGQGTDLSIAIEGIQQGGRLMPGINNHATGNTAPVIEIPVGPKLQNKPGVLTVHDGTGEDGSADIFVDRLIYPELLFSDPEEDNGRALKVSMGFDGRNSIELKTLRLYRPAVEDGDEEEYTMPRNTWLFVDAEVTDSGFDVITRVLPWNNAGLGDLEIRQWNFTVDRSLVVFPAEGGSENIEVFTDHPEGWQADMTETSEIEALAGLGISFAPAAPMGETDATTPFTLVAEEYTGGLESVQFTLKSGNLRKKITVIRLPGDGVVGDDPAPTNVTMYVGAFWKSSQYGERLIRIARPTRTPVDALDGDWVAVVVEGRDWIVLDTESSKDKGVLTAAGPQIDGDDTGFDASYRVNTMQTAVGGIMSETNPQIYFRIGLTSVIPDGEHRYGMVLLVYTNGGETKYQRIFIRQGEEADYLYRREGAVEFSPYNLTAPAFREGTASQTESPLLNARGGEFTRYPTQAGAYFQWAPTYGIHAFNPGWPNDATAPANWNGAGANQQGGAWSSVKTNYETCPEGWRRIVDDGTQTWTSEVFATLKSDNLQNGYYADGFFDRRILALQRAFNSGGRANAVAVDNYDVAYPGTLFYDPDTYASLFFPAAGMRYGNGTIGVNGQIFLSGGGLYWTGSETSSAMNISINYGRREFPGNSYDVTYPNGREYGFSIRCVKDEPVFEPPTPEPILVLAPPGVIGIKHSDLMALRNGEKTVGDGSYSLTVRGSSTYKGSWVEDIATNDPNIGRLEWEPVYMVYFQWGSTVGMVGGKNNGEQFNQNTVVWANPEYSGGFTYNSFTPAVPDGYGGSGYNIPDSPEALAKGWGDPCDYVGGGTHDKRSGWKTPTGNPWTFSDGVTTSTPFGPTNASCHVSSDFTWRGIASDDMKIYLPETGYRMVGGNWGPIYIGYWTSTANGLHPQDATKWRSYALNVNVYMDISPTAINECEFGLGVRCVRPTTR